MNRIITISRELGSGGRELGKRLAEALDIAYYDKEIVEALAQKSGLAEEYLEGISEKRISFYYPITYSNSFSLEPIRYQNNIMAQQNEIIKELAEKSDCVIVGRAADVILADYHPLRIFVYAEMAARIERCRRRDHGHERTDWEYKKFIKATDRNRSHYRDLIGDREWGNPLTCDLMVNTTNISIKSIIPGLVAYQEGYFQSLK
ncbi:AAA family ATPase [Catenisphaera adipataccumulans]|jgi:cytidylate kinase|uniref:Cytidylate kinase n=1 Tax=Catenisphaera adipataccumulans TaxID=700500 RepID=A0A7W8CZB0_9FIRM|nr:cytidylate kinase-like family protein [Catenisphaera adipataccumulans]MBB5183094.1 cytidylate kinase [Catenisphaera adipataccumulans]